MSRKKIFKICVIGDMATGKTSLLDRYVNKKFSSKYKATIGADCLHKEVESNDVEITFQIWDTAGQERFQSLGCAFYKGADCCILVYDVTNANSFEKLENFRAEFIDKGLWDDPMMYNFFVVGTKCDLDNVKVDDEEVKKWCSENGNMPFFKVSNKHGDGIEDLFKAIADSAAIKLEEDIFVPSSITLDTGESPVENKSKVSNENSLQFPKKKKISVPKAKEMLHSNLDKLIHDKFTPSKSRSYIKIDFESFTNCVNIETCFAYRCPFLKEKLLKKEYTFKLKDSKYFLAVKNVKRWLNGEVPEDLKNAVTIKNTYNLSVDWKLPNLTRHLLHNLEDLPIKRIIDLVFLLETERKKKESKKDKKDLYLECLHVLQNNHDDVINDHGVYLSSKGKDNEELLGRIFKLGKTLIPNISIGFNDFDHEKEFVLHVSTLLFGNVPKNVCFKTSDGKFVWAHVGVMKKLDYFKAIIEEETKDFYDIIIPSNTFSLLLVVIYFYAFGGEFTSLIDDLSDVEDVSLMFKAVSLSIYAEKIGLKEIRKIFKNALIKEAGETEKLIFLLSEKNVLSEIEKFEMKAEMKKMKERITKLENIFEEKGNGFLESFTTLFSTLQKSGNIFEQLGEIQKKKKDKDYDIL